ncbi:MAG TPA: class I SAM-dependent methyltransferase [Caulobacteraceae bacterium]|nr:class I SAM-dependent methyltransferase [Caulobacteraceae bacterium]
MSGPVGWLASRVIPPSTADSEAEAVELLAPQAGEHILIIGFGQGLGIAELAQAKPNISIVGVDPSAAMTKAASARNKALIDSGRLRLETATLAALANRSGADEGAFDGAMAVHCLQSCLPLDSLAGALGRLLRPGGRFVTVTHGPTIEKRFGSVRRFMDLAGPAFTAAGFDKLRGGRGRAEKCHVVVFRGRKTER